MIGLSTWALNWSIGVNGYPLPQEPLHATGFVHFAHSIGAQVVQFADNLHASDAELLSASSLAYQLGLSVELGIVGTEVDSLKKHIAFAARCGASILRTLPHCGNDVPSPQEIVERLSHIHTDLDKYEITLAIENHDHYTSQQLLDVVRRLNHPRIGICLDTVNNYGRGESYRETTQKLLPYIKNFHYKDFVITRVPHQTGFTILGAQAGQGLLDLSYFRQILSNDVNWIIEQWVPWQSEISKTISLEQSWATKGMQVLHENFYSKTTDCHRLT